jgi:hypothetical protein
MSQYSQHVIKPSGAINRLCQLVKNYLCFRDRVCPHHQGPKSHLTPMIGSEMFPEMSVNFNQMIRLIVKEEFISFILRESFGSYILNTANAIFTTTDLRLFQQIICTNKTSRANSSLRP